MMNGAAAGWREQCFTLLHGELRRICFAPFFLSILCFPNFINGLVARSPVSLYVLFMTCGYRILAFVSSFISPYPLSRLSFQRSPYSPFLRLSRLPPPPLRTFLSFLRQEAFLHAHDMNKIACHFSSFSLVFSHARWSVSRVRLISNYHKKYIT